MTDSRDIPEANSPQVDGALPHRSKPQDSLWNRTIDTAPVYSHGVNAFWNEDYDAHEDFRDPKPWLDALENVQSYPTAFVSADEITQAVLFRLEFLPYQIRKLVAFHSPEEMYWGAWDHRFVKGRNEYPEDFTERIDSDWEKFRSANMDALQQQFQQYPYHILPIWTGQGHWNLIFIVLQKSRDRFIEHKISTEGELKLSTEEENQTSKYQKLVAYAIIDPRVSGGKVHAKDDSPGKYNEKERGRHIAERLDSLFSACNLIAAAPTGQYKDSERLLWVPKQEASDDWSSGLRVIDTIWELFRRIMDMEISGIRNIETLFRPLRPFFNSHYVRLDVAGAIAAQALQHQMFTSRIVLAHITETKPKSVHGQKAPERVPPRGKWHPFPRPGIETIPEEYLQRTSDNPTGNLANPGWYAQGNTDKGMPELLATIGKRYEDGVREAREKSKRGEL